MIYLDYASTAPLDDEIRIKYTGYLKEYFANSAAHHPLGLQVSKLLEQSRRKTAALLGVRPEEILFTSGASEANSEAIKGYCLKNSAKGKHVITTAIEHSSVLNSFRQLEQYFGFSVTYLGVDEQGKVRPDELAAAIRSDTILVSVMMVNNETGSIQPIEKIKTIVRLHPGLKLHVDCVQAAGKLPFNLENIDMASIAGHKLGGLKGCGVLVKKKNVEILPLISGGDQEYGLRGGTENALNYALFGDTLEKALGQINAHYQHVSALNERLRAGLSQIRGVSINSPDDALPYILNFSCAKLPSEVHMNALSKEGFCVSSHSTCNTSDAAVSYVLEAMGIKGERQRGVIRVSLGAATTEEECDLFVQAVRENCAKYGIH